MKISLSFFRSVCFLALSFVSQTAAQEDIPVGPVQLEDLPHGPLRHRKLLNLDGEIVVNGDEMGPFTLPVYDSSDTSGTTQIYKTVQTIPAGTLVTCQMRLNSALNGGIDSQWITIQGGSMFTTTTGDAFDVCRSPSSYGTDCRVQYASAREEPFYVLVYSLFGDIFDGYVRCTGDVPPTTPAPTSPSPVSPAPTTAAPVPAPTIGGGGPTPTTPTAPSDPTRVPTFSPTPVPTPTAPTTSPPISPGAPAPTGDLTAGQSIEFVLPGVPANAEVTCALSCDETTGDNRVLYANFGSRASSTDWDDLAKGSCPVITTVTAPDGCEASDLYVRAEVNNADSTVTNGFIRCDCDACNSCWDNICFFFRGIRSQVAAYWTG